MKKKISRQLLWSETSWGVKQVSMRVTHCSSLDCCYIRHPYLSTLHNKKGRFMMFRLEINVVQSSNISLCFYKATNDIYSTPDCSALHSNSCVFYCILFYLLHLLYIFNGSKHSNGSQDMKANNLAIKVKAITKILITIQ